MLTAISEKFAQWLIANGANPDDEEIYAYGIECFLSSAITYGSLILLALFLDSLPGMLLWLAFWLALRYFLGGYHASTHWRCYWGSLAVGLINILLFPYLPEVLIPIIVLSGIIFVFRIAPVTHPHHPLSAPKHKRMRLYARIIILIEAALVLCLYLIFPAWAKMAALGILSAVFLSILGKLKSSDQASCLTE